MRLAITPLLAALAPLTAADTLTIGPGDSLHAAVAAVAPGDTICMLPGEYVETGTLTIDKPLTLLGAGSDVTSFKAVAGSIADPALPLFVDGLGPGEEVRVIGLELRAGPFPGFFSSGAAVVTDCAGPVVLADVRAQSVLGDASLGLPAGVVQVRDSAQVLLADCSFTALGGSFGGTVVEGMAALYVEGSTVAIEASTLTGGAGIASFPYGIGAPGGPAVRAVDSVVRLGRSSLVGGHGTTGFTGFLVPGLAGDGAPGLYTEGSTVYLRGGPDNALVGGQGSLGLGPGGPDYGAGGAAAFLDAGSVLTTTPDAALAGGVGGDGSTAPTFDPSGAGAVTPLAERLATIRTTPLAATIGGPSTTELAAEPFGIGVVGFSIGQSTALALPGVVGAVVLDTGAFGTLPALALDASGQASLTSTLPSLSTLAGVTVVLQGLVVNPSGLLSVSPPTAQGFLP